AGVVLLLFLFPPPDPVAMRKAEDLPMTELIALPPDTPETQEPPEPDQLVLGETDGTGNAFNSSTLTNPQTGAQADREQASLTRDPAGDAAMAAAAFTPMPRRFASMAALRSLRAPQPVEPAKDLTPSNQKQIEAKTDNEKEATPPAPALTAPADIDVEKGVTAQAPQAAPEAPNRPGENPPPQPEMDVAVGDKATNAPPAPLADTTMEQPPTEGVAAPPPLTPANDAASAEQEKPSEKPVDPREPTAAGTAGKPMESTDRESDAFSQTPSVEMRNGRVVARKGREFKLSRPRENLYAFVDGATLSLPVSMVFRLRVDDTGRVRNAVTVRSSGSASLDRAFELAMYESWFEPRKNREGRAVGDEFEFPITLR
ncbi:MAG TPA: hypothetical protein VGB55_03115, partial [Tepidisphaeraceae bacterium]